MNDNSVGKNYIERFSEPVCRGYLRVREALDSPDSLYQRIQGGRGGLSVREKPIPPGKMTAYGL